MTDDTQSHARGGVYGGGGTGPSKYRSFLVALVVVSATVLAGCSSVPIVGDSGSDTWEAGGEEVPEEVQANMSTSPATIYERVDDLLGVNGTAPEVVAVANLGVSNASTPALSRLVGLPADRSALIEPNFMAYTELGQPALEVSVPNMAEASETELEVIMAYYYALGVHQQQEWNATDPVVHSTALSVASAYASQHTDTTLAETFPDREGSLSVPIPGNQQNGMSALEWAGTGAHNHYVSGVVAAQLDSPSDVPAFYEGELTVGDRTFLRSPTTPSPGVVNRSTSNLWISPNSQPDRSFGELGTWALLSAHLDNETAVAAARGLSADYLTAAQQVTNETVGVYWTQRWDSEAEADEFVSAMEGVLDQRRSDAPNEIFRVQRPAPDVTVVVTGDPGTVNNTDVGYENGTVQVGVGL